MTLTRVELDVLVHAAALGIGALHKAEDKIRTRDLLERLRGVLDGSA